MGNPDDQDWERARKLMVQRWSLILRKIDEQDGPGTLALANMLDDFCSLAAETRKAATSDRDDPAVPVLKFPPDADLLGRCAFCRVFAQSGGCFAPLHALNKAVLNRRWNAARVVAQDHLKSLLDLRFSPAPGNTVH
jgi:hypothetical protein